MKKLIAAALAALAALVTSTVMAQQPGVTYDVTDSKGYLATELGIQLDQKVTALKCSDKVSTPDKLVPTDKSRVHQNCFGSTRGVNVIIGWTPTSNKRYAEVQLPLIQQIDAGAQGFCDVVGRPSQGLLVGCNYAKFDGKVLSAGNMQILYMKAPGRNDILVIVHDNMGGKYDEVRQVMQALIPGLRSDPGYLALADSSPHIAMDR